MGITNNPCNLRRLITDTGCLPTGGEKGLRSQRQCSEGLGTWERVRWPGAKLSGGRVVTVAAFTHLSFILSNSCSTWAAILLLQCQAHFSQAPPFSSQLRPGLPCEQSCSPFYPWGRERLVKIIFLNVALVYPQSDKAWAYGGEGFQQRKNFIFQRLYWSKHHGKNWNFISSIFIS